MHEPESPSVCILLWIATSTVAIFFALQLDSAAFVDGQYIPVGNDSFYHARRILDAAVGDRGFYQFDNMIHAPEGSWLTWPWAYNWLAAQALSLAMLVRPSTDPMAFLAHLPVAWLLVNFGLLTLIGRQLRLSTGVLAVALLGFALMPLTQNLHGLGFIDHHFLEFTFVLATILTGLRFLSPGKAASGAIALGAVLGIAPAFHNGLFILQLPILITMFVLWLRQDTPKIDSVLRVCGALVVVTLLVVLPSAPFREFQFEFWTLSWFHLYIASSSAICLAYLGWKRFSTPNLLILFGIAAVLVIPLITKIVSGTAFLSGDLILLDQITEVKSPLHDILTQDGIRWAAANYSYLFFLAPVLLGVFAWRAYASKEPAMTYFSIFAVFGLTLLLTQFRLHPFGSWVFIFGSLLLFDDWQRTRDDVSTLAATAATLLMLAFAFQPPLRTKLFQSYAPGLTKDYAATRTLFPSLAQECARETGIVLSYNDDGHYIRYHTDCSVLTNNFLMTPFHAKKIMQADAMLQSTPAQFLEAEPQIDYVFVRMYEIFENGPDGVQPVPLQEVVNRNAPLFVALTFDKNLPENFKLIDEVRVDDPRDFAYARVFKIVRD